MLRKLTGIAAISVAVAGCATKPLDNTPLNPTAVIERHVTNNGIKGFFPFETNDTNYVRANMRRDESEFKGTGTFSGFLVGSHSRTKIARIDRKLLWTLDTKKEQYTECPLKGCAEPAKRPASKRSEAAASRQPEAPHEQGCTMRIASSNFIVTATGQKKTINGFDTEEYLAVWTVALRDQEARTTTSKLSLDLWTTPLTQSMRDAMNMEAAYARAYAGSVSETAKAQIVPNEASKLIASYLAKSMSPGDLSAFFAAGKQLQKVKGYPISSKLTWNMDGNACAPKQPEAQAQESESQSRPVPKSASGLASGLAGMYMEKKTSEAVAEAAGEPILSFTAEIKQFKVEPLHDSLFEVPTDYKRVQPQ
jgi:hypothetical protein